MALQLTRLNTPNLSTDYGAENQAMVGLGNAIGSLIPNLRKQQLDAQKQQLLGSLTSGNPDYTKVGMGLVALGDTQGGAALLGLGQKAAERQADQVWQRGVGLGSPAAPSPGLPSSLINNESGGRWDAQNNAVGAGGARGHFGRLQFGQARLQEAQAAGAIPQGTTPEQFLSSPELQKQAEAWHWNDIDGFIKEKGYDQAAGGINGVPITVEGMRAVAHLGGKGGLQKFIETGGRYNPADENGTRLSDYFQRHGGGGAPQTQVAEAQADLRAPGGTEVATGPQATSRVPGLSETEQVSISNDPTVKLWSDRFATAPSEKTRAIAKQKLDVAIEDAKQRRTEGRDPDTVREFVWARRNGMTKAQNPAEYAREKEKPRGPMAVSEGQTVIDPETGRIIFGGQGSDKAQRDVASRTKVADEQGLQGEQREAYIFNGRIPVGAEKTTEGQANAGLYADRMKEAEAILSQPAISSASNNATQRLFSALPMAGNYLVSPEFQQADQAKRNFINANLRRESGAVISPQEFDSAEKQYFPQPGDSPQVLEQKTKNRLTAINGISRAAGAAYAKQQAGGQQPPRQQPARQAPEQSQPDLTQAKQASDGKWYVPDPGRPGKYLMVER